MLYLGIFYPKIKQICTLFFRILISHLHQVNWLSVVHKLEDWYIMGCFHKCIPAAFYIEFMIKLCLTILVERTTKSRTHLWIHVRPNVAVREIHRVWNSLWLHLSLVYSALTECIGQWIRRWQSYWWQYRRCYCCFVTGTLDIKLCNTVLINCVS